jgi:hypothetical protein
LATLGRITKGIGRTGAILEIHQLRADPDVIGKYARRAVIAPSTTS